MEFSFNSLKSRRREAGFTQEQIAEKLGVSRQSVAKWECGASLPDIENVIALADLYGVSVDSLARNLASPTPRSEGQKHIFGVVRMNESGEITLPEKAREVFGINPGDSLLLLGDEEKGMALIKVDELSCRN